MARWPKRKKRPDVDEYGRTSLWYHSADGDVEGVKSDLKKGMNPSIGDYVDYTPLHVAVQNGHIEIINLLLNSGADVNAIDNHGNEPLWTAILSAPQEAKISIIKILLNNGANPDHVNKHGRSPKQMADQIGHGLEELLSK